MTQSVQEPKCVIRAFEKHGALFGLWICFQGEGLKFPSKNRKRVVRNRHTGKPFILKDKKSQIQLDALTQLYRAACKGKTLTFGNKLVKALVIASFNQSRQCDSHNINESIADWLQSVGVIINDSDLQIECIKNHEFEPFSQHLTNSGFPGFPELGCITSIVLQVRNDQLTRILQAHYLELLRISTGRTNYIG